MATSSENVVLGIAAFVAMAVFVAVLGTFLHFAWPRDTTEDRDHNRIAYFNVLVSLINVWGVIVAGLVAMYKFVSERRSERRERLATNVSKTADDLTKELLSAKQSFGVVCRMLALQKGQSVNLTTALPDDVTASVDGDLLKDFTDTHLHTVLGAFQEGSRPHNTALALVLQHFCQALWQMIVLAEAHQKKMLDDGTSKGFTFQVVKLRLASFAHAFSAQFSQTGRQKHLTTGIEHSLGLPPGAASQAATDLLVFVDTLTNKQP